MAYEDAPILITGGSGFIGQQLITSLLAERDANLYAICRDEDVKDARVMRGDLRNYDDVQRAFYESDPALVIHLAAVAPVSWSYRAPRQAITSNVLGATNVLDACREFDNVPCILISSDKSYGKSMVASITEEAELNPRHPYDASKAAADMISISYACTYGVPVQILRPCNVYGPGDFHWSRLIPAAIKAALLKKALILRSDGSPIRDYIYIDDLVDAIIRLIDTIFYGDALKNKYDIWNIAAWQTYSVLEVLAHIDSVLGTKIKPELGSMAMIESETDILHIDGSAFMEEFEWAAKTPFDFGLELTANWIQSLL
jgi:CDP-glucose 4,6-dehydratase